MKKAAEKSGDLLEVMVDWQDGNNIKELKRRY